MEMESSQPLAVVTGASSGIGYELAKVFARNGFDLLVAAEDPGIVEAAEVFRREKTNVEYIQVDLSERDGVKKLYDRIKALGKPVEACAINAGVGVGGEFVETDLEREINMIKLNVISSVALAKYVVQDMVARGHGRILFTSSIAGDMPGPYHTVYSATKAFVQFLSEGLREEVKDKGVVVTALQPGPTDTNFFERADMMDTKVGQGKKDDPAMVAQEGFEALMKGSDHVVTGLKNKVQSVVGKVLPQTVGVKAQAAQTKPGSGHK